MSSNPLLRQRQVLVRFDVQAQCGAVESPNGQSEAVAPEMTQ